VKTDKFHLFSLSCIDIYHSQVFYSFMKKAYSIDEVASIVGVSRRTVWNWILDGHLKYFKVGRVIRIFEEDLENFFKEHKQMRTKKRIKKEKQKGGNNHGSISKRQ
jgi:excisionase family DNA binding protein